MPRGARSDSRTDQIRTVNEMIQTPALRAATIIRFSEEVRSLARQSSDVLGRMKHRISEDDGDVVKAGRHTTF